MKYVIMCGGYYEQWKTPKQLQVVNGERIVERTIRLLKENGVKDICISSNDERFKELGVEVLEHENSYRYENGVLNGYWLDAFYPHFRKNQKVTFIFGDVYFTENAINQIVECKEKGNILFGSKGATIVGKVWGEPFAYVVNDMGAFYDGITAVKKLQDEGKTDRVPIVWELYRYLNGIDVNTHLVKPETYKVIDDGTDDADTPTKLEKIRNANEIKGNVFTVHSLNEIGGGEQFLYYLVKKYKDRDITIYYVSENADQEQIERISKYARIERYNGQKIKCKRVFFNYNQSLIDKIEADEKYQIIHINYKTNNLKPKSTDGIKFIAVSEACAKAFREHTGLDCEVCYNPVMIDAEKKRNKPITLISATRLKRENKGTKRMQKLADLLEKNGVDFVWYVYADCECIKNKNVIFKKPCLNVADYMLDADWLVQLSDDEAYGFSVVEANMLGVPVITTPCPVFKELGIKGITVDWDVKNVDIDAIKKGMTVEYKPPKDMWGKLLTKDKSNYKAPTDDDLFTIRIKRHYHDIEAKRIIEAGEELTVTRKRMKVLKRCGVVYEVIRAETIS